MDFVKPKIFFVMEFKFFSIFFKKSNCVSLVIYIKFYWLWNKVSYGHSKCTVNGTDENSLNPITPAIFLRNEIEKIQLIVVTIVLKSVFVIM